MSEKELQLRLALIRARGATRTATNRHNARLVRTAQLQWLAHGPAANGPATLAERRRQIQRIIDRRGTSG